MSKILDTDVLSTEEKVNRIINAIDNNQSLFQLEDLKKIFGTRVNIGYLEGIKNILNTSIDDNNLDKQDEYYEILDKIIDAIVSIRYNKNKKDILYSDIVSVNDDIQNCFKKLDGTDKDNELFEELITKLYLFTGKTMELSFVKDSIKEFLEIFRENGIVTLIDTSYFCNVILNYHRNYYMSNEKAKIISEISYKLELSDKKKKSIINNKKMELITEYIKNNNYDKLKCSEEDLNILISIDFVHDKKIKKANISLSEEDVTKLKEYFKNNGVLEPNDVKDILGIDNEEICIYISRKYNRIKARFFSSVDVDVNFDEIDHNLPLNPTNFIIGNSKTYKENLSKILLVLNDELSESIIDNKELLDEIKYIILFGNLIEEFSIEVIVKILSNYSKIVDKLYPKKEEYSIENILSKMAIVINLANGYASIDDVLVYTLTENVITKLGESVCTNYKDVYKEMLNRNTGYIPTVIVNYNSKSYVSGDYSDPERLLIGKIYDISCIDLDNPGESTYLECLEKKTGDVIMIRDENGNLVDRMLLVRRGNVVQIIMKALHTLPFELYQQIGNQIITQSKNNNDNIDYVVVASIAVIDSDKTDKITDSRFISLFPHSDLEDVVSIVATSDPNELIEFNAPMNVEYVSDRKDIDYNSTEYELTRLRALNILLTNDEIIREEKSRDFEKFDMSNYTKVVNGQDWYLALKENGELEQLVLPTSDDRKYLEIEYVKENMFNNKRK